MTSIADKAVIIHVLPEEYVFLKQISCIPKHKNKQPLSEVQD